MENLEYFKNYHKNDKDKYKNYYLKYKYLHLKKCDVCDKSYLNIEK